MIRKTFHTPLLFQIHKVFYSEHKGVYEAVHGFQKILWQFMLYSILSLAYLET